MKSLNGGVYMQIDQLNSLFVHDLVDIGLICGTDLPGDVMSSRCVHRHP